MYELAHTLVVIWRWSVRCVSDFGDRREGEGAE